MGGERRLCAWLGTAVLAGCASDRGESEPWLVDVALDPGVAADVRALGRRAVEQDGIVGLAIGVAVRGEIVLAEGFGHADLERTRPVDADTVFDIASTGKHFTAAAVLKLVERGELALDARVRALVPGLPERFPDATVEQLLRHTSGFVGAELDEGRPPADYARPRYGAELLTDVELQEGRTLFAPEETWVYCNPGYLVLGLVVEAVSGERYDRFVRRELLDPNGLTGMTVCERAEASRMADSLRRTTDGVERVPLIDMTAYSGQGSICSSVVDLLRWSRALEEGRVVSPESLARLRSPTTVRGTVAAHTVPYGMAQRIGSIGRFRKVGHTGTFDGGSATLASYPEAGLEIAVLANTYGGDTPHARRIETAVAKLLLGHVEPDVEALRRPVSPAERRAIEGTYTDGTRYTARLEGDDLVVLREGEAIERLVHVGGLRFRQRGRPDVHEWFLMDGERAGWWIYSLSGNFLAVLRREAGSGE